MTYFSEENVFVDLISNAGYRPYRDINVYESEREQIEQMESDMFVIKDHPERIILKYKNERIRLHRMDGRIQQDGNAEKRPVITGYHGQIRR